MRSTRYAATLPVTTAAPTSVTPISSSTPMCTGRKPATTSTENEHTRITSVVPRSCCRNTSAIIKPGERDAHRQPTGVEVVAMVMAIARDRDDHHDLRDLRRLELQRSDLEPRLRALVARADHEHADQQREHGEVHERPQLAQPAVVDREHHGHRDDAEHDREALALDVIEPAHALRGEPRPRRRVDHQQAERRQRERQRQQQRIGVAPVARLRRVRPSVVTLVDRHDRRRGQAGHALDDPPRDRRRGLRAEARPAPRRRRRRTWAAASCRRTSRRTTTCRPCPAPARYRSCPRRAPDRAGSPGTPGTRCPSGRRPRPGSRPSSRRGSSGRSRCGGSPSASTSVRLAVDRRDLAPRARVPERAVVRERRVRVRELERRDHEVALADRGEDVVEREPRAVVLALRFGLVVGVGEPLLPLGIGHAARWPRRARSRSRRRTRARAPRLDAHAALGRRPGASVCQKSSPTE